MKNRTNHLFQLFTLCWGLLAGCGLMFTACKDKAPQERLVADTMMIDTVEIADTTLYGRSADAARQV